MHVKTYMWSVLGIVLVLILGVLATAAVNNPVTGLSIGKMDVAESSPGYGGVGGSPVMREDYALGRGGDALYLPYPPSSVGQAGEYVVKNGYMNINVRDINEGVSRLSQIADQFGGDIINRSINEYDDRYTGYVQMRVDAQQFDAAIAAIKDGALAVTNEQISAEDVTSTVIDIEARLENARLEEQSYQGLLDRAVSVTEILEVQSALFRVRSEIESQEAQLEYYTSRADYSVISVNLTEETSVGLQSSFRPLQAIIDAAQTVVEVFQGIVIGLIYLIIVGGAVAIPVALVAFIAINILRKKRVTNKKKK